MLRKVSDRRIKSNNQRLPLKRSLVLALFHRSMKPCILTILATLFFSCPGPMLWAKAPDSVMDIVPQIDVPSTAEILGSGKAKGRLKVYRTTASERKGIFVTVGGFGPGIDQQTGGDKEAARPDLPAKADDEHDYESYLEKGFDVYIMSWYNGTDYMQKNAMVLVELLSRIQTGPTPDSEGGTSLDNTLVDEDDDTIIETPLGPEENLALVVPSMGGIVSRYALAYMETEGLDHGVDLWMTLDSPHTGAYIPIGVQYMAHYLNGVSLGFKADDQLELVDSPAAKQLLLLHYSQAENPLTPLYHSQHEKFYRELEEAYGDYPSAPGLRRVALSNGAGDGRYSQLEGNDTHFFELPKSEPRLVKKSVDVRLLKAKEDVEIKVKGKVIWEGEIDFELRLGLVMDAWSTRPNDIYPLVFRADGGIILFVGGKRVVLGVESFKDISGFRAADVAEAIAGAIINALDLPKYVPEWAAESKALNIAYEIIDRGLTFVSPSISSARVSTDYAYDYLPGGVGARHIDAASAIGGTAIGSKVCFIPATSGVGYEGPLDTPLRQIPTSETPFDQIYFEESLPDGVGNRSHVYFKSLAQDKIDAELDALLGGPAVFSSVPRSTPVDSTNTTLTIVLYGQNFTADTQAYWNGASRTTNYVSSSQIQMVISAADVDQEGSNEISITDPGSPIEDPRPLVFKVVPTDINVEPSNWYPGDSATFFYSGVATSTPVPKDPVVSINGSTITVTASQGPGFFVLRPYELEADLGNPPAGEYTIIYKVNALEVERQSRDLLVPEPFILSASPSAVTEVDGPINFEVTGSGFLTGSHIPEDERTVVRWNGEIVPAEALSREFIRIEAPVHESLLAVNMLEIENPEPGGGSATLEVLFEGPVILESALAYALDGEIQRQQLQVVGENYSEDTRLYWNGEALNTEFVSSTELRAFVPDALATTPGSVSLSARDTDVQLVPEIAIQQIPPYGVLLVQKGTPDGEDGLTWATAFDWLSAALEVAEPGQEIWVAAGTHAMPYFGPNTGFELVDGVAVYGGFSGSEILREQRNPDPETNGTVLSADRLVDDANFGSTGDNSVHVVMGSDLSDTTVLDGFTLQGGNGVGDDNQGGGLRLENSNALLRNLIVEGNTSLFGGGIYLEGGSPQLSSVIVRSNSSNAGGGVMVSGGMPQFDQVFVLGNRAAEGGGFYFGSGAEPTITNSVIAGNISPFGAGIHSVESTPSLRYVTISGNEAGNRGGALNSVTSVPFLENCILWGNTAPTDPQISGTPINPLSSDNTIEGGYLVGTGTSDEDPLFVSAPNPGEDESWYPDSGDNFYGNLRLLEDSPAADRGAYEGTFDAFSTRYPELPVDGDANNDGRVNLLAYLFGEDPERNAQVEGPDGLVEKSDEVYFEIRTRTKDGAYDVETYLSPNLSLWYPVSESAGFEIEILESEELSNGLTRLRGRLQIDAIRGANLFVRSEGSPKGLMSNLRSLSAP